MHVSDLVQALILCMERDEADGQVFNVGSGVPISINAVAKILCEAIGGGRVAPTYSGEYRAGDIRHCYADISRARTRLGYQPRYSFQEGVAELIEWVRHQTIRKDMLEAALAEARARGVVQ